MREYGSNINLPSLDNLFSSEQERQDAKLEKIQILPLTELHPFRNHPFQVRDDDEMDKMVDSVKEYGVMTPAIVRPRKDGGYEIVAGHRRCHASQRAGVETMPCIVRDMDDDTAIILMVDSNCQREHILPSEKAKAYQMKLEAVKRKAGRPSKNNSAQVGPNLWASEKVAADAGESRSQVKRFIALNNLTPALMQMVDEGRLKTTPAVELSYLTPEEQEDFLSYMESEGCTPSLSQAQKLKEASKESVLTPEKIQHMVAAAMEKKRLGLCSKTLVAVPNHLTGQFASEALKLYPNANILVTTQRDFEKSNRKRFCAKIATGNYDIVVIGHSQFEKIPLSDARKAEFIRKQIDELEMQLESMDNSDSRLTVKQLESKKKQLKTKLSNLLDAPKRDDVVTFEELGADSLMVDEAHNFKNLMTVTKMHNIAGISTTESQKASDLFMKCQYLDEITGARGVTFATGTPISNSMTELYTMQRYLQQYTLERNGLANFDSWAATFGETVTAIELAPEGYTLIGR